MYVDQHCVITPNFYDTQANWRSVQQESICRLALCHYSELKVHRLTGVLYSRSTCRVEHSHDTIDGQWPKELIQTSIVSLLRTLKVYRIAGILYSRRAHVDLDIQSRHEGLTTAERTVDLHYGITPNVKVHRLAGVLEQESTCRLALCHYSEL